MESMLQHLVDRHFDIRRHRVWIDNDERVATFPLWNLSEQLVGYQAYRPDADKVRKNDEHGRYYTFRAPSDRKDRIVPSERKALYSVSVWGLDTWSWSKDKLYVTEGIFDACRLTRHGVTAFALMSNDPDGSTRNWLSIVGTQRKIVAVCDSGKGGRKLAKLGHEAVTVPEEYGDLGNSSEEFVTEVLENG